MCSHLNLVLLSHVSVYSRIFCTQITMQLVIGGAVILVALRCSPFVVVASLLAKAYCELDLHLFINMKFYMSLLLNVERPL